MEYLEKGYSIIPVGNDKRPLLLWKEFQSRQATEDEVLGWLKKWPEMNIGIVTGKISGLTVLDLDVGHDKSTPINTFPKTLTHQTPSKGIHLIYKYIEGFTVSANAYSQYPYLDVRSDTGYIVAPCSETEKGQYKVLYDLPIAPFPVDLFPNKKISKTLEEVTAVSSGNRNESLASFAGMMLFRAPKDKWKEVLNTMLTMNKTYTPPLSEKEVKEIYRSISKKENERRANINGAVPSPYIVQEKEEGLRKNGAGAPYKDMANVYFILNTHPLYKDKIKYNAFRREIEVNGLPYEDKDIGVIQYFIQTVGALPSVSQDVINSAVQKIAFENEYDEAQDWINSLAWDGTKRLESWLNSATGVLDDEYHQGIGTQWFMGIIQRLMNPGCTFDYALVLSGKQNLGKTSLFRILGGKWYKGYTGSMENKDFYLTLRGAMILDLDEGASMSKTEAIKLKSVISETHDEFRAPYDRLVKKYPRRFVFSMSTNDAEPFRDVTGNRRYWVIDIKQQVRFKWLEENRDQLFAEAHHYFKNKDIKIAQVPFDEATRRQEDHLPDDAWRDLVISELRKSLDYCKGNSNYSTTITEIYSAIFGGDKLDRLARPQEMRIANILRKEGGLEKKQTMHNGERKTRWSITDEKIAELKGLNLFEGEF